MFTVLQTACLSEKTNLSLECTYTAIPVNQPVSRHTCYATPQILTSRVIVLRSCLMSDGLLFRRILDLSTCVT